MNPHKITIVEGLLRAKTRTTTVINVTTQLRDKTITCPINMTKLLKEYDGLNVKITIELKEAI